MVDCFDFCSLQRRCAIGQKTTQWCAEAERIRGELQRNEDLLRKAMKALKDIRSISHINSAMNKNPFSLVAVLAEIHHIADAVLSKEDRND